MTFYTDGRDFVDGDAPWPDEDAATENGRDAPSLLIHRDEPVESVHADQPEELLGPLVVREMTTLLSSAGGRGKTTLLLQLLLEAAVGRSVWGFQAFTPPRPLRCLYVNAEDSRRARNYWLSRILHGAEHDGVVPFHSLLTREQALRPWRLTAANLRELCAVAKAEAYDVVALDPAVALMPAELCTGNNIAIRDFLERTCGELHAAAGCAIVLSVHDSKAGLIASGGADFTNFARVALQLHRATLTPPAGHDALVLETHKANQRYRFREVALTRAHATLLSHVVSTTSWDTAAADPTASKTKVTKADAYTRLAEYFLFHVMPLPEESRTTRNVRTILRTAAEWPGGTAHADAFAAERVRYEKRKVGRTRQNIAAGLHDTAEPDSRGQDRPESDTP